MSIIDLTHPITADTPVYPGDPKVLIEPAGQISKDGFADHKITFGTHVGTHIDAPIHMLEGGKTLKNYPNRTIYLSCYLYKRHKWIRCSNN